MLWRGSDATRSALGASRPPARAAAAPDPDQDHLAHRGRLERAKPPHAGGDGLRRRGARDRIRRGRRDQRGRPPRRPMTLSPSWPRLRAAPASSAHLATLQGVTPQIQAGHAAPAAATPQPPAKTAAPPTKVAWQFAQAFVGYEVGRLEQEDRRRLRRDRHQAAGQVAGRRPAAPPLQREGAAGARSQRRPRHGLEEPGHRQRLARAAARDQRAAADPDEDRRRVARRPGPWLMGRIRSAIAATVVGAAIAAPGAAAQTSTDPAPTTTTTDPPEPPAQPQPPVTLPPPPSRVPKTKPKPQAKPKPAPKPPKTGGTKPGGGENEKGASNQGGDHTTAARPADADRLRPGRDPRLPRPDLPGRGPGLRPRPRGPVDPRRDQRDRERLRAEPGALLCRS